MTRASRLGLPLVLAFVAAAFPAHAHQGDPNVFTRIDAITPDLPGVVVQIRSGVADQLFVVNSTDAPVEVLGADGAVFLRIGPDEVVADVSSYEWAAGNRPFGDAGPRSPARGRFEVVASGSSWGWFDHRLHEGDEVPPRAARAVTKLSDWTVPLRHRGTEILVKGHVEYRPVLGTFRSTVARTPDGVSLDVLDGRVPGLFLRWEGAGTLTVTGIDGEPFARFGANGVEVNESSTTWHEDQRLRGKARRPPGAGSADPRWQAAAAVRALTWLDRRLAYSPGVPPADALRARRPTTVVEWDIPVDVNGVPGFLQGTTTWVPNAAGGGGRPWLPVALAAVAVVVAVVALRRRAER